MAKKPNVVKVTDLYAFQLEVSREEAATLNQVTSVFLYWVSVFHWDVSKIVVEAISSGKFCITFLLVW